MARVAEGHVAPTEPAPNGQVQSAGLLVVFEECHRLVGDCIENALSDSGLAIERLETTRSGVILSAVSRHALIVIDSAVLDDFPGRDFVEEVQRFGVTVLVVSTDPENSAGCGQRCGADAVVASTAQLGTLVTTVHRLLELSLIEQDPGTSPDDSLASLTPREQAVLECMMRGLSADEIAATQFVAVTTVRSQIRAILTKLNVRSQLAAVAVVHRMDQTANAAQFHQI